MLPRLSARTMTPWNHALRVSFVCSKAWVVLRCLRFVCIVATATVVLQHSSKFVATIAVTARLKFVWQGSVYIWCCGEGVGGGRGILDPGCSGRQIRGRLRSTLGRCGWRLPTLDVAGAVLWVPQPDLMANRMRQLRCASTRPSTQFLAPQPRLVPRLRDDVLAERRRPTIV